MSASTADAVAGISDKRNHTQSETAIRSQPFKRVVAKERSVAGTNPEEIVKKFSEAFAAYNRHDLDVYFSILDPDYEVHDPVAGELKGRETMRKVNEELFKTFPDLEFRDINIAARGNRVAVECMFSGTFKGPFELPGRAAISPTGRRVEFRLAVFYRLNSKGLVSEGRNYYYDFAGFLKQLGLKA